MGKTAYNSVKGQGSNSQRKAAPQPRKSGRVVSKGVSKLPANDGRGHGSLTGAK